MTVTLSLMSATSPARRLHMLLRPTATSASNFFLNKSFNGQFTAVVGLSSSHKVDQQYVSWTSTRRNYSTKRDDVVDVKEVIIPVPWGHIAGWFESLNFERNSYFEIDI